MNTPRPPVLRVCQTCGRRGLVNPHLKIAVVERCIVCRREDEGEALEPTA